MEKKITIPEKGISEHNTIIISLISGETTTFYDVLSMEDGETHIAIHIDETEDETRRVIVPKRNIAYIATAVRKTKFSDFMARITGAKSGGTGRQSVGWYPTNETEVKKD